MSLPASWLTDHAPLIPVRGSALDLACGRGRHALWLAERGLTVTALDRDASAIDDLRATAAQRRLTIDARVEDVEAGAVSLGTDLFDVIVVVHYLHRPLFPAILTALAPKGVLVYDTFTQEQASLGKPTNPDFLLMAGELLELVRPLTVRASREGLFDGRFVSSVIAQKN